MKLRCMLLCLRLMPVFMHVLTVFIQHLLYARFWEYYGKHIKQASCLHGHGSYNLKVLIDIQQKG